MAFADEITKPISNKILLLEISTPIDFGEWINNEAGIWKSTITPANLTFTDDQSNVGYYENTNVIEYFDIASVLVNDRVYIKVTSFDLLRAQEAGFYFDQSTNILYLHHIDWDYPINNKVISVGTNEGFCNKVDYSADDGCYYNDVYYEPRVLSTPSISKKKDPLFYGSLSFDGGNVTLINNDGYFDDYKNKDIFRQQAVLKLGFEGIAYSEYRTVFTGFVESFSFDWEKFVVKLQDKRKNLSRKIPYNVFTQDEWPFLEDGDVNKVKPLAWGSIRNAELLCVNKTKSPAYEYYFFIADTEFYDITSVDAVYVEGEELSSAFYSVDLTTGILTIESTYIVDNLEDVTADFTAVDKSNSLEIIKDLLDNYAQIDYNSVNYNTTEYAAAVALARDSSIYVNEPTEMKKIIELCCVDSDAIFLVQDDGKYTARIFDENRTPTRQIYKDEWIDSPNVAIDPSKFLSSARVTYLKDQANDKSYEYLNEDYQLEVLERYKAYQTKTFETNIDNETDAIAKSEAIMQLSKDVPEVVKRTTKIQNVDLEIMDFVICDPKGRISNSENLGVWEIQGISKNLNSYETEFSLRFIEEYTP